MVHHCVQSHMVSLPCVGSALENVSSPFCQEHMLHIPSGFGCSKHSSFHQPFLSSSADSYKCGQDDPIDSAKL